MRNSRILAIAALTIVLWGASASAAFADDPAPVDPPPVVEPPPVVVPPPVVEPPAPPPVLPAPPAETPDQRSIRITGLTVAEYAARQAQEVADQLAMNAKFQAQIDAFYEQYGDALIRYHMAHPGESLMLDYNTGVITDMSGNLIDTTSSAEASADQYGVSSAATVEQLEAIIVEPALFDSADVMPPDIGSGPAYIAPVTEPAAPASDDASAAVVAGAGWFSVAALAFWRRRYRAIELLKKAKAAAGV